LKAGDVNMDGMPELRIRKLSSASHDPAEPFIGSNLPIDGNRFALPILLAARIRYEARPQNDTLLCGVAGRNAGNERI
jgi:hypothetical protein